MMNKPGPVTRPSGLVTRPLQLLCLGERPSHCVLVIGGEDVRRPRTLALTDCGQRLP